MQIRFDFAGDNATWSTEIYWVVTQIPVHPLYVITTSQVPINGLQAMLIQVQIEKKGQK